MTVQNTPVINKWAGNGTNKDFDFDFRIDSASQLRVSLLSDYDTPLVLGTDYRIIDIDEGANYPLLEGGTIEYPLNTSSHDVLTSEDKIILELNIAFIQNTPFSQGGITASAIEECLDYNVRLMQRLKQDNDGFQEDIQTQVDNANTNASTALSKSTTALSNSNTAVSTANTASVNATNAVATANNASSVANIASTNATNAVNTANSASSTATAASNKVDEFGQSIATVVEAASKINQLEQSVTTATNAATTATNKASEATTAAQTATNKAAEAASSASAATAKVGNLSDLTTTEKGSLVGAINEVAGANNNANIDLSNLSATGEARFSNVIPTGIVTYFAKGEVPNGFLICNGSTISRTTYASLFSVIGTTFGSGDGSTTFSLPNLMDKYIKGSTTVGSSLSAKLPNISGSFTLHNDDNQVYLTSGPSSATGAFSLVSKGTYKTAYPSSGKYAAYSISFKASNSNTIYDSNITTVQPPSLTMLPCIKY